MANEPTVSPAVCASSGGTSASRSSRPSRGAEGLGVRRSEVRPWRLSKPRSFASVQRMRSLLSQIVLFSLIACASQPGPEPRAPAEPAAPTSPGPASAPPAPSSPVSEQAKSAVDAPDRDADDRALDAGRKPAEMLTFFGIQPGMRVAELMAGRGYTAELLARAVGPSGEVYGQNNRFILERFAEAPWSQ